MVVRTGTATEWFQPYEHDPYMWVCPVRSVMTGSDLLAEALRMSGVVRSLGPALRIAEAAELEVGYFGHVVDEDDEFTFCDETGENVYGEKVKVVIPCVIARVDVPWSDR